MKRIYFYFGYASVLAVMLAFMTGCKKDKAYALPVAKNELQNDAIKRSIGPNIVGDSIEFAYAMAIPATKGKLISAEVEASIAGAAKTWLEHRSYSTGSAGQDVPVTVGTPSVTSGTKTTVTFNRD